MSPPRRANSNSPAPGDDDIAVSFFMPGSGEDEAEESECEDARDSESSGRKRRKLCESGDSDLEMDIQEDAFQSDIESDVDEDDEIQTGLQQLLFIQTHSDIFQPSEPDPPDPHAENSDAEDAEAPPRPQRTGLYTEGLPFMTLASLRDAARGGLPPAPPNIMHEIEAREAAEKALSVRKPASGEEVPSNLLMIGEEIVPTQHPILRKIEKDRLERWKADGLEHTDWRSKTDCPLCLYDMDPPHEGSASKESQTLTTFYAMYDYYEDVESEEAAYVAMAEFWDTEMYRPFTQIGIEVPRISPSHIEWHFMHTPRFQRRLTTRKMETVLQCAVSSLTNTRLFVQRYNNGVRQGDVTLTETGLKMLAQLQKMSETNANIALAQTIASQLKHDNDLLRGPMSLKRVLKSARKERKTHAAPIAGTNAFGRCLRIYGNDG